MRAWPVVAMVVVTGCGSLLGLDDDASDDDASDEDGSSRAADGGAGASSGASSSGSGPASSASSGGSSTAGSASSGGSSSTSSGGSSSASSASSSGGDPAACAGALFCDTFDAGTWKSSWVYRVSSSASLAVVAGGGEDGSPALRARAMSGSYAVLDAPVAYADEDPIRWSMRLRVETLGAQTADPVRLQFATCVSFYLKALRYSGGVVPYLEANGDATGHAALGAGWHELEIRLSPAASGQRTPVVALDGVEKTLSPFSGSCPFPSIGIERGGGGVDEAELWIDDVRLDHGP